jgi:hypothetical protein
VPHPQLVVAVAGQVTALCEGVLEDAVAEVGVRLLHAADAAGEPDPLVRLRGPDLPVGADVLAARVDVLHGAGLHVHVRAAEQRAVGLGLGDDRAERGRRGGQHGAADVLTRGDHTHDGEQDRDQDGLAGERDLASVHAGCPPGSCRHLTQLGRGYRDFWGLLCITRPLLQITACLSV